jgi:hypothetical protein
MASEPSSKPETESSDEYGRSSPSLAGWSALPVGLFVGWRVWGRLQPEGGWDPVANEYGLGVLIKLFFVAWWTLVAFLVRDRDRLLRVAKSRSHGPLRPSDLHGGIQAGLPALEWPRNTAAPGMKDRTPGPSSASRGVGPARVAGSLLQATEEPWRVRLFTTSRELQRIHEFPRIHADFECRFAHLASSSVVSLMCWPRGR